MESLLLRKYELVMAYQIAAFRVILNVLQRHSLTASLCKCEYFSYSCAAVDKISLQVVPPPRDTWTSCFKFSYQTSCLIYCTWYHDRRKGNQTSTSNQRTVSIVNTTYPEKRCHYILPLTLPNMLTDFQNSFTDRLSSKFVTKC